MRNTTTLLAAVALAGLTLPGFAQQDTTGAAGTATGTAASMGMSGTLSAADKLFVVRAADGNMAEVMTSQMALKKAGNGEVKQVAQRMIQEHGQAQNDLMQLAQGKGVSLPPTVGPTHQIVSAALGKSSGGKFDQMYMGAQVEDHENTIALFQQEIASGQDTDVKAYASKYLPKIVGHTAMIYGAASGVGVTAMQFRPSTPPMAGMAMSPDSATGSTGTGAMNGGMNAGAGGGTSTGGTSTGGTSSGGTSTTGTGAGSRHRSGSRHRDRHGPIALHRTAGGKGFCRRRYFYACPV